MVTILCQVYQIKMKILNIFYLYVIIHTMSNTMSKIRKNRTNDTPDDSTRLALSAIADSLANISRNILLDDEKDDLIQMFIQQGMDLEDATKNAIWTIEEVKLINMKEDVLRIQKHSTRKLKSKSNNLLKKIENRLEQLFIN